MAAKALPERHACGLSEDIPTGNIDGRLDIRVSRQSGIHGGVDVIQTARVKPHQMGCENVKSGTNAGAMCRKVGVSPGASLAPARQALIRVDPNDRAVEVIKAELPTRQEIGCVQRQIDLPDTEP